MMSIIFLTGMLLYEGYRLWLWSNLAPTLPILPPAVDLDGNGTQNDYISSTAMPDSSATTFVTDKHYDENGLTLVPDIKYQTTTPNKLSTVQFVNNTNKTATVPERSDPLDKKPEIETVSDQSDTNRNYSKLSDLLLLLRLHSNATHTVNIYIKKKPKDSGGKVTAFDIIFNALNSKPQSRTSNLSHAMNSIKPTCDEIPNSTVTNADTSMATDELNQISRFANTITIPQNIRYERNTLNNLNTYTDPEKTSNGTNEDSETGLTQDNLTLYTYSQLTKSKVNTYRLPTTLAYDNTKNTKSKQESNTTLKEIFKKVKRNRRYIIDRKLSHSRLYYNKSNKTAKTEQKSMVVQQFNKTIESSTPKNVVNEWNSTTHSLKITEIEDDEDEFSYETEEYNQFTTLSLKTLGNKHELNSTPIDNEEDESESVEENEETTKTNKNKSDANDKHIVIKTPKNIEEITTISDEEDETESGEGTEVSTAQEDPNKFIENQNRRLILPTTKRLILKKHIDAEVYYDTSRYENNRKIRTSKPFLDEKVTRYQEEETDSAETTSESTTVGDDPEETPGEGMDILFILKTRLNNPTGAKANTSVESKDLSQTLAPKSTVSFI